MWDYHVLIRLSESALFVPGKQRDLVGLQVAMFHQVADFPAQVSGCVLRVIPFGSNVG